MARLEGRYEIGSPYAATTKLIQGETKWTVVKVECHTLLRNSDDAGVSSAFSHRERV